MTSSHNHLDNNNPLAGDLFNPLAPELGEENVDIGLGDREGSYIELTKLNMPTTAIYYLHK